MPYQLPPGHLGEGLIALRHLMVLHAARKLAALSRGLAPQVRSCALRQACAHPLAVAVYSEPVHE